jgi:hypothetical protein
MKKFLLTAAVLAFASSAAYATEQEAFPVARPPVVVPPPVAVYPPPAYVAVCPPGTRLVNGSPYGPQCVPFMYGPTYPIYGVPQVLVPQIGFSIGPHGRFSFGIGL